MTFKNYSYTVVDRFLKYISFDTQSDDFSETSPSTSKQKILGEHLVKELLELGLEDVKMDKNAYVMATLPANTDKNVPVIGFISHLDTSPANSGKDVKAVFHENYQGGDIELENENQIVEVTKEQDYDKLIGCDLITTDGSTLLGGDDKAGIAEIMDAINYLKQNPEIKHGTIKIAFTPDEEIGKGSDYFDVEKFGAKFAYTVDGGIPGDAGIENFSAEKVIITFHGKAIHPGYAKNILINSTKIASSFIESLPKDKMSPETTEDKEGFVHVVDIKGTEESSTIIMINRDFDTDKLAHYRDLLKKLCEKAVNKFPGSSFEMKHELQYENTKPILDNHPQLIEYIVEAMKRIAVDPVIPPTRGGTDGAHLTYKGLPCPNIFAGERNFHSKTEFIVVEDMKLAVQNIIEIIKLWEENT
ncbi:MAG: peptidase T [Patescibacteria group bacterium]|nr:peptidase T [Patescibacteria group bacterium]